MSRTTKLLLASLTSLVALASLGGCLIVWAVSQDPDGLPCAEGNRQCLVGYTCVDGVCRKAAAAEVGDPCIEDEECADGLVCTNVYDEASCGDDISCALGRQIPGNERLRCRRVCDPAGSVTQCAPGERCWPDAKGTGWCQSGVCNTPTDCGVNQFNGLVNVCYDASLHPGGNGSGLCTSACDPLQCNPTTGCPDCPLIDVDGDGIAEIQGCEPYEGVLSNMGCVPAGNVPVGGPCDGVNTACVPGAFCLIQQGATNGYCSRICRVGGGNPACDASQPTCNPINGQFGFCS